MNINLGSGRIQKTGYVNIDCTQFIDGNGKSIVDVVLDIERERLPYKTGEVENILADNVLEHLENLRFVLNECHRVLKPEGTLHGRVPVAGTMVAYKDPTHKRNFIKETFSYFTGTNPAKTCRPSHPKYADYGYYPWEQVELYEKDDLITFTLKPRKIATADLLPEDREIYG